MGDEALDAERTFEAIEPFSGALAFKPDSMLAHLKRAETYRRRGDRDLAAALRDAREANTLDPTAPQPIELLGDIHSRHGPLRRADGFYNATSSSTTAARGSSTSWRWRTCATAGPRDAIEPLRRAIARRPLRGSALSARTCVPRYGTDDEGLRELNRAVALNGALIPAREELAGLHLARGRPREAVEQLEAIAALDPLPGRLVDVALASLVRASVRPPS